MMNVRGFPQVTNNIVIESLMKNKKKNNILHLKYLYMSWDVTIEKKILQYQAPSEKNLIKERKFRLSYDTWGAILSLKV